jgi:hypothetical protein
MKKIDLGNGVECKVDDIGTKYWYLHGKLHRTDGPAIEWVDGTKYWYLNAKFHRTDGPAIERAEGSKEWYFHDKRHRVDGPAVEDANGSKSWYYEGKYINCQSTPEFQRLIRLKAFW